MNEQSLNEEASTVTEMLSGKVVSQIYRHREEVELSITGGTNE